MSVGPPASERFEPRASRAMAEMFDGVTGRYDFLNQLMTLGRDGSWRREMWRAVPEEARIVLDLCTGNGASLPGLRRPGRLVLGVDVSLGMLEAAAETEERSGWAPRLICADAFRLPLRARAVDAVTIAFGVRNLRPRAEALAEIARVLRPGGRLVVLEATAPAPGPMAPLHRFHLTRIVPLLGRLSPDPSAYRYLASSVLEFGDGTEFDRALAAAGFEIGSRRRFLAGATGLWSARRTPERGEKPSEPADFVQAATDPFDPWGKLTQEAAATRGEARVWIGVQAILSAALLLALVYGMWSWHKLNSELPLASWQRIGGWVLLVVGVALFAARTAVLIGQIRQPPLRR
jgi:demethylmenaquinone methyltransferase/2-methoxy-6-polyprenyl-1,4-benzoquinol methylase